MLTGTQTTHHQPSLAGYHEPGDALRLGVWPRKGSGQSLILIVEDDPGLRMLLEKSLQNNNRRIINAGNGQEGLLLFANQPVDLVILDAMMPLMDGFETCGELRKVSDVPIVMLSGVSSVAAEARALRQGVDVFLHKPVTLAKLQLCVQSLLTKPRTLGLHPFPF